MEILLILALIFAAGAGQNTPPQQLIHTIAKLAGGDTEELWKSDLFKDVRILGMTPAELVTAAKDLNALVSELTPSAAPAAAPPPPAPAEACGKEGVKEALAPIAGIADENIERMLGKYFS